MLTKKEKAKNPFLGTEPLMVGIIEFQNKVTHGRQVTILEKLKTKRWP